RSSSAWSLRRAELLRGLRGRGAGWEAGPPDPFGERVGGVVPFGQRHRLFGLVEAEEVRVGAVHGAAPGGLTPGEVEPVAPGQQLLPAALGLVLLLLESREVRADGGDSGVPGSLVGKGLLIGRGSPRQRRRQRVLFLVVGVILGA